jgi:hypothetical protein
MKDLSQIVSKLLFSTAILLCGPFAHQAVAASLTEGFESPDNSIPHLESEGWTFINNSSPLGSPPEGWTIDEDSPTLFPHSGSNWIGTGFQTGVTGSGNVVSDWMILPTMTFQASASLTFFTISAASDVFPDRLQVLVSLNGNSSNVGPPGSTSNFGDFTQKLLDINPTYSTTFTGGTNGYPSVGANNPYVEYGPLALGQFAGDTGRIAFHYFLTDTLIQGSHIAIDDISVNNIVAVPEPSTVTMLCGGLIVLAASAFRQRRRRLPLEKLHGVA